jgi:hypothetical protein
LLGGNSVTLTHMFTLETRFGTKIVLVIFFLRASTTVEAFGTSMEKRNGTRRAESLVGLENTFGTTKGDTREGRVINGCTARLNFVWNGLNRSCERRPLRNESQRTQSRV